MVQFESDSEIHTWTGLRTQSTRRLNETTRSNNSSLHLELRACNVCCTSTWTYFRFKLSRFMIAIGIRELESRSAKHNQINSFMVRASNLLSVRWALEALECRHLLVFCRSVLLLKFWPARDRAHTQTGEPLAITLSGFERRLSFERVGNSTPAIRDEMTKQSSRKNAVSQLSCLTLNVLSAVCLFMMRTTISLNYAKLIPLNMSTVKAMAAKFDSHRDD